MLRGHTPWPWGIQTAVLFLPRRRKGALGAPVEQHAAGWLLVPACPPALLVEVLQGLGQTRVDDEAHVGLVDAHAECDCCHHDLSASAAAETCHAGAFENEEVRGLISVRKLHGKPNTPGSYS